MNKKQILSTVLAGLITLNTLGGCTNSNNASSSVSTDTSVESEYDSKDYRISTICASATVFGYRVPEDFILIGNKGYRVEELVTNTETYPASERILEDGTKVLYEPYGGHLIGSTVYVETVSYKPVTGDKAQEIIDNYLSENSLKLEK